MSSLKNLLLIGGLAGGVYFLFFKTGGGAPLSLTLAPVSDTDGKAVASPPIRPVDNTPLSHPGMWLDRNNVEHFSRQPPLDFGNMSFRIPK